MSNKEDVSHYSNLIGITFLFPEYLFNGKPKISLIFGLPLGERDI